MDREDRLSWTDAELAELLAAHFGDRLSPPQLEQLVADVAAGLTDRGARAAAERPAGKSSASPAPEGNPARHGLARGDEWIFGGGLSKWQGSIVM